MRHQTEYYDWLKAPPELSTSGFGGQARPALSEKQVGKLLSEIRLSLCQPYSRCSNYWVPSRTTETLASGSAT
jgi:hypothetical protein